MKFYSFFSLSLILFTTSSFAQTIQSYECQDNSKSDMQTLTMRILPISNSGIGSIVKITITQAREIIQHRELSGLTTLVAISTAGINKEYFFIQVDKDPYAGLVGTFYWTFRIAASFETDLNKTMAVAWEGTPSGMGNNSGIGFVEAWTCRAIN